MSHLLPNLSGGHQPILGVGHRPTSDYNFGWGYPSICGEHPCTPLQRGGGLREGGFDIRSPPFEGGSSKPPLRSPPSKPPFEAPLRSPLRSSLRNPLRSPLRSIVRSPLRVPFGSPSPFFPPTRMWGYRIWIANRGFCDL